MRERQVEICRGGTVPESVALWVKFSQEDKSPKNDLTDVIESVDSGLSAVTPLELYLTQKGINAESRDEIFRRSSHQWRRDRNEGEKGHPNYRSNKPYKQFGYGYRRPTLTPREEIDTQLCPDDPLQIKGTTNRIIEHYFGIPEGPQRTDFLRKMDGSVRSGDPLYGADKLRASVYMLQFHGLDNYPIAQASEIILAAVGLVNESCKQPSDLHKSIQLADLVTDTFGPECLPILMEHYKAFPEFEGLVPREHSRQIYLAMFYSKSKDEKLMHRLGYESLKILTEPITIGGKVVEKGAEIPIIWYKPVATKPV